MPLSQEEIDAAMGGFSAPQPLASTMPVGPMADGYGAPSVSPAPDMYQQASDAFTGPPAPEPPYGPPSPLGATNAPSWALNDETIQAAKGAFAPPAAPPADSPVAPVTAPPQGAAPARGAGLTGKAREAESQYLGSFDRVANANRNLAFEEREKGAGMREIYEAESVRNQALALAQHDEMRQAQDEHAKYLADTKAMVNDIAAEKIDPNQFFHSGNAGRDITVAIGAALLAGIGAMASRDGRNPGVDAINAMIDRNIQTQEKNIGLKRAAIGARQDVYQQMRQELGDKQLADDKFRIASLESVKNRILAFSAGSESKIDAARTDCAVAMIQQQQDKAMMTFAQRAEQVANQAASATANHRAQEAQRQFDNVVKARELAIKEHDSNTRVSEVEAKHVEAEAKRQESMGGGKERRNKLLEVDTGIAETNKQMDAMTQHPALDKIGAWQNLKSGVAGAAPYVAPFVGRAAVQALIPGTGATAQDVSEINVRILQSIGKYAKDADGKPNKVMIQELKDAFEIHPDDTKERAIQKIRGVQRAVNALAAQEGGTAGRDPDEATNLGFKPGITGDK